MEKIVGTGTKAYPLIRVGELHQGAIGDKASRREKAAGQMPFGLCNPFNIRDLFGISTILGWDGVDSAKHTVIFVARSSRGKGCEIRPPQRYCRS
jgi:hypothetical protein